MVASRIERKRKVFQGAEERHRIALVNRWNEHTPDRTAGFTIQDDLIEGNWNDRLNRSGVRKIMAYINEPTQFLILKGTAGLGKSTLAVTMIREMIESGKCDSALYRSAPMLMQEFSFPDRDREDPVELANRVDVLLLDDVGAGNESITPHQKKMLWSVIDHRWGNINKMTIMTTNMSITSTTDGQGLIDWFGESAWDRIKDDLTLIDFHGESMRG